MLSKRDKAEQCYRKAVDEEESADFFAKFGEQQTRKAKAAFAHSCTIQPHCPSS